MNAAQERALIRTHHLILSIPILGFLYGPISRIPQAAFFTRVVAFPAVAASGIWLWLRPRILSLRRRDFRASAFLHRTGVQKTES